MNRMNNEQHGRHETGNVRQEHGTHYIIHDGHEDVKDHIHQMVPERFQLMNGVVPTKR